jgi:hypothetical protein
MVTEAATNDIKVGIRYWFYNESFWDNRKVETIEGDNVGFPGSNGLIWRNKKEVFWAYYEAVDSVKVEPSLPPKELKGSCKNCGTHSALTPTGLYGFNLCSPCYQKYIR